MTKRSFKRVLAATLALAGLFVACPASAQLGPLAPGLPALPALEPPVRGMPSSLGQTLEGARQLDPQRLLQLRLDRIADLVRANRRELDLDDNGEAVVRGQLLAVSPTAQALEVARQAGFTVTDEPSVGDLDLGLVLLTAPKGIGTREAIKLLRRLDPAGVYDFNHLYAGSGTAPAAGGISAQAPAAAPGVGDEPFRMGFVDTGVYASHPDFRGATIVQRPFAPGGLVPAAHGTAVVSLALGRPAKAGKPVEATLLVADVYGRGPAGGSARAVLQGLSWLAAERAPVINVSLVGPPNAALAATVTALRRRGVLVVAPVGNDGPAAPPRYPASYPEVVAVTAVDARGKVLLEAGRAQHLDFAAQGAGVSAAKPGRGRAEVRGTSFASPVVAARLAQLTSAPSSSAADAALDALARTAVAGPEYGRGLVGFERQTARR